MFLVSNFRNQKNAPKRKMNLKPLFLLNSDLTKIERKNPAFLTKIGSRFDPVFGWERRIIEHGGAVVVVVVVRVKS